jgi:disulfide bond formation protein DsbB
LVVVPIAAVGTALFTQRVLDMQPCPWCVLQRVIFLAIALAALPAGIWPARALRWLCGGVAFVLALCGAAAALWQHFVAAASQSCAMTLADSVMRGSGLDEWWPEGFSATASCADAAARLLGVPYEFYSLALFIGLAAIAALLLRGTR